MKLTYMIFFLLSLMHLQAQEVKTDSLGFKRFSYQDGDTTYYMKQYFLVLLKSGANRSQGAEESAEIQKNHLAHINWMADQGYLDMAGPMGDDGDIRGILIMRVPSLERARELAEMDPAVKAGRLIAEVHPWWTVEGGCLK